MLQLANIEIYFAQRGEYPLFLLDDIDAELDYRRIGQLWSTSAANTDIHHDLERVVRREIWRQRRTDISSIKWHCPIRESS